MEPTNLSVDAPKLPPLWFRVAVVVGMSIFVLLIMASVTLGTDHAADWRHADTVIVDIAGLLMIAALVVLYGTSFVKVASTGLRVRNTFGTHEVPWPSITGAHWGFNPISPDAVGIVLELASGKKLVLNGVFDLPFGKVSYAETWMEWIEARAWSQVGEPKCKVRDDASASQPHAVSAERRRRRARFALTGAVCAAVDLRVGHPVLLPAFVVSAFVFRR